MMRKTLLAVVFGLAAAAFAAFPQDMKSRAEGGLLREGVRLYGKGGFAEAAAELKKIGPESGDYAEALYWAALAELAAGKYREALADFEALERHEPGGRRASELPYHKGRLYFYLGRYEEAVVVLAAYAGAEADRGRRARAQYWAGESLYALGQLDQAENVFAALVEQYPESAKYEASLYRMELIKQKKIEAELLAIIKWSHEESLKSLEEQRRREKNYDLALAAYRKRIAELEKLPGTPGAASTPPAAETGEGAVQEAGGLDRETAEKLRGLKAEALALRNSLAEQLGIGEAGR